MAKVLRHPSLIKCVSGVANTPKSKLTRHAIKMIFPIGLLIFPSLMIVLLTPAALRLRDP